MARTVGCAESPNVSFVCAYTACWMVSADRAEVPWTAWTIQVEAALHAVRVASNACAYAEVGRGFTCTTCSQANRLSRHRQSRLIISPRPSCVSAIARP